MEETISTVWSNEDVGRSILLLFFIFVCALMESTVIWMIQQHNFMPDIERLMLLLFYFSSLV